MVNVIVTDASNSVPEYDLSTFDPAKAAVLDATASIFKVRFEGFTITFQGAFTYNSSDEVTSSSTITAVTMHYGTTTVLSVTGLSLTYEDLATQNLETLLQQQLSGDDTYTSAWDGGEYIETYGGNDTIQSGTGNDTIDGGAGDDTIDGGAGFDTLVYDETVNSYNFTFHDVRGFWVQTAPGSDYNFDQTDYVTNVETVQFHWTQLGVTEGNDFSNVLSSSGTSNSVFIHGRGGHDTITGGDGSDYFLGGAGNDRVTGGLGHDDLYGGEGADTLSGDEGEDWLFGGDGNDSLYGGANHDSLEGGTGNDFLGGGDGSDTLLGGEGNDTLASQDGDDLLYGGDGDDKFNGYDGNDTLIGGLGNDDIYGGRGQDRALIDDAIANATIEKAGFLGEFQITSADGVDVYSAVEEIQFTDRLLAYTWVSSASVTGDQNPNTIHDVLWVGSYYLGSRVDGATGDDYVFGYRGNDTLLGGTGNDQVEGDRGNDLLLGGQGADTLRGGYDDDTLQGGSGNDSLDGGFGADILNGGNHRDTLQGSSGNDLLDGGRGRDKLLGGTGIDTLKGGNGADTLSGGTGGDRLSGGSGRDVLLGHKGDDLLTGGGRADTFVFHKGHGNDTITDFTAGQDHIQIGRGASRLGQLDFEAQGDDVLVSFADVTILVEDISLAQLQDADNFLF
ncbi:calcium-binding protein [Leisingera aquaemixtae]|uniref:calcium-binding protein n=1 Tax=Leisingera aquaemixtae TaxID=1396826 RepID=UPI0039842E4E